MRRSRHAAPLLAPAPCGSWRRTRTCRTNHLIVHLIHGQSRQSTAPKVARRRARERRGQSGPARTGQPQVPMHTPEHFSCFLAGAESLLVQCGEILLQRGHSVLGVITSAEPIAKWAKEKEIRVVDPKGDYRAV